jgi:hypothetical protein
MKAGKIIEGCVMAVILVPTAIGVVFCVLYAALCILLLAALAVALAGNAIILQ